MSQAPKKIILASTSPTRRALLDATGLRYEVRDPHYEENAPKNLSPKEVALFLALGKARAASKNDPEEMIIGADQVLDLDGVSVGKFYSEEEAKKGLRALSGRSHFLHTGVAILSRENDLQHFAVSTKLSVRNLTEEEINSYVATNEWKGCAGGYRIEGQGVCLFEKIEGDYFNILGLPLVELLSALRSLGVSFWRE
jgi:septum formation protein